MATTRYDVAVIGGGLVGLASAYRLLEARPSLRVAVLEKEASLARHQSGRNSGVAHSGIYYEPGSQKARLCIEGKAALERFAEDRGIPFRRCGKLVVATTDDELPRLRELLRRGRANGVEGLTELDRAGLREVEPHAEGVAALHSPGTAVTDFREVARALGQEVESRGGEILLEREVVGVGGGGRSRTIVTTREEVRAAGLVACAGLHADRVAALSGAPPDVRIVPFRGRYLRLAPRAARLVRALLYPVPAPGLPFLGVHFTRRIDGEVWAGPNAVLAGAREGYRRGRLRLRDVADTLLYPGFLRLVPRYAMAGAGEMWRDLSRGAFLRAARRYLPDLEAADLLPGPVGVRAQALSPDGSLVDDFRFLERPGEIHVLNAPSPAATAALAIGRVIAERAARRFEL